MKPGLYGLEGRQAQKKTNFLLNGLTSGNNGSRLDIVEQKMIIRFLGTNLRPYRPDFILEHL